MSAKADELSGYVKGTIGDWLAAHGGGMISSTYTIVDYIDAEGERAWAFCTGDDQSFLVTLGLLRFATLSAEGDVSTYLERVDGDGDS